ncbi:hypothetical protein GS429_03640 [Natronorubrum sp. JWXQ-INN-674]|uniref:Alanyl-transfer RNA synthetases family profile domain-containing protein n=1 Tax=Natronorubrum halalkaliphilum TaxID=2691917 RepID=A0A6B0VJM7_9EURY|nr:alanine--tRNA ligase-related protein [Natronorubrum halalkaliphilum]MXV61166.1 hypothetical protein [Natronorubrum halalkaliphilum]
MTGQRAAAEPYTTRFESEVTSIDGREVWLERSYFYGESGGQPADRGTIGGVEVADVQYVDGEHVHVLAEEPSFRVGKRVLCSIDWSFRMYCMRAHTASHLLYGAGRRLLEDLGYGGFDISEERVRVDLKTSTEIDDELLLELDTLVNRAVWESRPVTWEDEPVADARERDDIAFNEATEEGAFRKGRVRVVTIGSEDDNGNTTGLVRRDGGARDLWDVAACGGTHVRNTREVGPVTVLGRSNPGEGLTRIELAVGPRAIDRREAEKRVAFASRRTLDAPLESVEDELARVDAEREELTEQVRTLRRQLVETRLEEAEPFERDGLEWVATTVEDVDSNEAGEITSDAAGDVADVVVLAGDAGSQYAVVATNGSVSAEAVVADLTDEFGGGGGGSTSLAQAGGFDATPEDIVTALKA